MSDVLDTQVTSLAVELTTVNRGLEILYKLVQKVATGSCKALVVSGSPGIGKSYVTKESLDALKMTDWRDELRIHWVKGKITAFQLYELFWNYRDPRDILIFDDCDSAFNEQQALNILKAATDSTNDYWVSWHSKAATSKEFRYRGHFIILTNYRLHGTDHYKAFRSRVRYLPLHFTPREIFAKVLEVADNLAMLNAVPDTELEEMLSFMRLHAENFMDDLNLRTLSEIIALWNDFEGSWPEVAEMTMLRQGA